MHPTCILHASDINAANQCLSHTPPRVTLPYMDTLYDAIAIHGHLIYPAGLAMRVRWVSDGCQIDMCNPAGLANRFLQLVLPAKEPSDINLTPI